MQGIVVVTLFLVLFSGASFAQTLQDYESAIDKTCVIDSDCVVKDVHNCCGYYPVCVNVNAVTDPEQVEELCRAESMAGVCGFEDITGCHCDSGQCAVGPSN